MAIKKLRITWFSHPILIAAIALFLLQIVVRAPSFFEPYWYGDEGIYLTIGQALNRGEVLYKDIIDHKTPLIYELARVESQLAFRWVLVVAMTAASISLFIILRLITRRPRLSLFVAALFSLGTALPTYEGLIPNGELFVMTFILLGFALACNQPTFRSMLLDLPLPGKITHGWLLVVAGSVLSLGILTKVPAVLDVLALFFIGWLALFDQILPWGQRQLHWRKAISTIMISWFWLGLGVVIPLSLSFVYFYFSHALTEYIQYGWLYSFRYSGEWVTTALPSQLLWVTTLSFKASLVTWVLLGLTLLSSKCPRSLRFVLAWLFLATFASLLSNRPYPHYFLQIAPPLALLLGLVMSTTFSFWKKPKLKHKAPMYFSWGFLGVALLLMVGAHQSVGMAPYQTLPYYEQFFKMEIGKISPEEYRNSFNWLMADNYAVAGYVRSEPEATLFIWGTNPVLYALSNKTPASRFTVAFHISEFQAEAETLQRLQSELPTYIIVMKDQSPLEGLSALLQAKYLTFADYDSMKVYRLRARPH